MVSHAHLDHVGWLPRLVAEGFAGPANCTGYTTELAAIVLRDAAHLQEEDAGEPYRHRYASLEVPPRAVHPALYGRVSRGARSRYG